jgi:restriction system protein
VPSPSSRQRTAELLKIAFDVLSENGRSLALAKLREKITEQSDFSPDDLVVLSGSGLPRWQVILHFSSVECVKAGFITKQNGVWHLTPDGEAVRLLGGEQIFDKARASYREWLARRAVANSAPESIMETPQTADTEAAVVEPGTLAIEEAEARARSEIVAYMDRLNPYEFQDLVAALLRAMGYSTPIVARPGRDGGTDIIGYRDPIGAATPHVRVQVKHRNDKASREEIASLRGIIKPDREIGLFVSTSGFTAEAVREAKSGSVHIELMDQDRLIALWVEHYAAMIEKDRRRLPLRPIYFLAEET